MNDFESLKAQGYEGFVTIGNLMRKNDAVPYVSGVYFVLYISDKAPVFVENGSGGHFKDRNPNVGIHELQKNWVNGTQIVYIGKAKSLNERLKTYMDFGQGKAVGHWGGRYIWQIDNVKDLVVCWHTLPSEGVAVDTEKDLIQKFKKKYNGMRPFANLRD